MPSEEGKTRDKIKFKLHRLLDVDGLAYLENNSRNAKHNMDHFGDYQEQMDDEIILIKNNVFFLKAN